jgi:cytochrome d ubiquinol oxidase subunit II
MIFVVMAFLWAALLLYILLGGADFGAGIIELITSEKNKAYTRNTMYAAIGPIWEANHMWLIIAIVVLFVGFPDIYTTVSTHLHIPLVIMLFGIIARGTAFTFRNYDAVKDNMQKVYNRIFVYSSFVTPFFLGVIAGSAVSGRIDPDATDFSSAYVYPWLNWFSVTVGFFTVAICGYLAAIFIIGETRDEQSKVRFIRKARQMNVAAVVFGALVFWAAHAEGVPLDKWLFDNPVGIISIIAAVLSLALLWYLLIKKGKVIIIRVLAGFQVTMILLAITIRHYPNIVILKGGRYLSLLEHAGQEKTIYSLAMALLLGSLFILPALFYLLYSFRKNDSVEH